MKKQYEELVMRNKIYIDSKLQERIRNTRVLIAGCGIGSTIAESLLRIGFHRMILVDFDTVALHNLNRQNYVWRDIGQPKVESLKRRLEEVYPEAEILALNIGVSPENVRELVSQSDMVFDTIDFFDVRAIVALHDEARRQQKPTVSALTAGWGAAAFYFSPTCSMTLREIFGFPSEGDVEGISYVRHFRLLVERIRDKLDEDVVRAFDDAFELMEDGQFCSAPQVAPGSASVAALASTIAVRILGGRELNVAPKLMLLNVTEACTGFSIDLLSGSST